MGRISHSKIEQYAKQLQSKPPRSDLWFQYLWKKNEINDFNDEYNVKWKKIIPDLVNHKLKYVIEIDGSFHDSKRQKIKDDRKDRFYKRMGYEILRIEAFNIDSFNAAVEIIERIRISKVKYVKPILRRTGDRS